MRKKFAQRLWPPLKVFTVRGKITFAVRVRAEDARDASDSVNVLLDSLEGGLDFPIASTFEWEVLIDTLEASE